MSDQPIEKQVEEAFACNCGSGPKGTEHWSSCPAAHRPAVLALLERREQGLTKDHDAQLAEWHSRWQAALTANERREQEHAESLADQRRQLCAETDKALTELVRVRAIATLWASQLKEAGKTPLQPKQSELGPCVRHGKMFWAKDHHHCCQAIESNDTAPCDCNAPSYCTACAQEKAAPGGVSNVES